jgi:hypothetical protein
MSRKQRSAYVKFSLVKMTGEKAKRLWCIAEPVQKEYPPRIAGAQVNCACASDYVCYRNRSERELLLVSTLCAGRLPGH